MPSSERLKRQLLELSILTLITVVIWIAYGVYAALTKSSETNVTTQELQALPPLLVAEQFDPLRERLVIDEETLSRFSASSQLPPEALTTPTPTPATPSPEASPAATPS